MFKMHLEKYFWNISEAQKAKRITEYMKNIWNMFFGEKNY